MSSPLPEALALSASDGIALSMVALLGFSLGMIVTILIFMARSGREHSEDVIDLEAEFGEEFDPDDSHNVGARDLFPDEPREREAWEREPDWWKEN